MANPAVDSPTRMLARAEHLLLGSKTTELQLQDTEEKFKARVALQLFVFVLDSWLRDCVRKGL